MKKIISLVLIVLLISMQMSIMGLTVSAATQDIYTYTVSNGAATISDCDTTVSGSLTIPSTLGGYPVTAIGKNAFRDCKLLTSVTVPDSVTSIGYRAFYNCTTLATANLPNSVTVLDSYAFASCKALTKITIPNKVTTIGDSAFYGCAALTDVTIPSSVRTIGDYAFNECKALKKAVIPQGVTKIGISAFYYCSSLNSVYIPTTVTSIGSSAFFRCTSLQNLYIKDIEAWCNISFASNLDSPLYYAKNIYLNYVLLNNLYIPESVTSIGKYQFYNCANINNIYIPESVTSIDDSAFYNCNNIKKIYYEGSAEEWAKITVASNNTPIKNATVYYNYTDIADRIESVSVSQLPDKVNYIQYEDVLDLSGGLLKVNYSDGQYKEIALNSLNVSDFDNTVTGEQSITVSYNGFDAQFSVNVTKNTPKYDIYAPGDLICDGVFKSNDLIIARKILLGAETDEELVEALDCTGDYDSNLIDLIRLKKHISNDVDADLFEYTLVDGGAVITGYDGNVNGAITVPTVIDGYNVTEIEDGAFKDCDNLTSILLPPTLKSIGNEAFNNCGSLISVAVPDSVESIGSAAFSYCENLSAARLSDNISIIPDNFFSNCIRLSKFKIPENVEEIGSAAFYLCSSLVELNVPEKVTVLNENAFNGCRNLVFIGLPENLKEIKTYTFYGCEKLQSVNIPITVVMVGDCAFENCSSLLSVVIPYETAFGNNVFTGCDVLVVKGLYGANGMDAALNSGVQFEPMECGHNEFLILNAFNPTCQNEGYSGDKYCVNCGKIEEKGSVTEKTAHITELHNVEELTCEHDGYTGNTVCTVCKTVLDWGYTIKATGHYAKEMPGYVAPTCTESGVYGIFTCEKCGEYINNKAIPATGHDTYVINEVHADCVNEGYSGDYKCRKCGEIVKTGSITAAGEHYYELKGYLKATCTKNGYTGDWVCKGCDDVRSTGKVTTKDHTPVTENYKAATCTENGYSGDSKCLECGNTLSAGEVLPLLGHKSVLINYVEATCEQDGYTGDQKCSVCGVFVSVGKVIEKTGHKEILINQKDYSETEDGYTGDIVCEHCGLVFEEGKVIPANHKHDLVITGVKEATCTEEGYTGDSACKECRYTEKGVIIPKLQHECTTTIVGPDCIKSGYTIDECANCDYEHKYDVIDALGHEFDGDWTIEKEANCVEEGIKFNNCSRCSEKITEVIETNGGHKEGENARFNAKSATCTEDGYTGDYVCVNCGETVYGEVISATSHTYCDWIIICRHEEAFEPGDDLLDDEDEIIDEDEILREDYLDEMRICSTCGDTEIRRYTGEQEMYSVVETVAPTCEEQGHTSFKCNFCDKTYSEYDPALGHDYIESTHSVTCTEDGYTLFDCSRCEHSYKENIVAALGHKEVLVNQKDATCTENGYTGDKVCETCKETISAGETIPSKGHSYGEPVNAKEATCTEEGYSGDVVCSTCGDTVSGNVIPSKDHSFGDMQYVCYHDSIDDPFGGSFDGGVIGDGGDISGHYVEGIQICSACGHSETNIVDSGDAMFNIDIITGGCETGNIQEYRCNYCDYSYSIPMGGSGHSYYYETVEPTCTEQGYTVCGCYNCGYHDIYDYVDPIGHSWDSVMGECMNCGELCDHGGQYSDMDMCPTCGMMACPDCGLLGHQPGPECPNYGGWEMWCPDCGGTDHMAGEPMCPMYGNGEMICFDCGGIGHMAGDPMCPMFVG